MLVWSIFSRALVYLKSFTDICEDMVGPSMPSDPSFRLLHLGLGGDSKQTGRTGWLKANITSWT